MLRFSAILGAIFATLVAIFMLSVNFGWIKLNNDPIVQSIPATESTNGAQPPGNSSANAGVATPTASLPGQNTTPALPGQVNGQNPPLPNSTPPASVAPNGYRDGVYKAEAPVFNATTGWKPIVTLEIKNGTIFNTDWDEIYKDGGRTKRELSEKGEFKPDDNSTPWHKQAKDATDYIVDLSTPEEALKVSSIPSVNIDTGAFLNLVKHCLAAAKTEQ